MDKALLEQELARAGWELDSTFSENLIIGNANNLCILIPDWSWQDADPVYELYDVDKNVAVWVRTIPAPFRAEMLLEKHGNAPEDKGMLRELS